MDFLSHYVGLDNLWTIDTFDFLYSSLNVKIKLVMTFTLGLQPMLRQDKGNMLRRVQGVPRLQTQSRVVQRK
jgi:hypothetical protein